jgi:hypothetical protein
VSAPRHSTGHDATPPRARVDVEAALGQPASFWLAALASMCMIIGGVGPWATAFTLMSLSGTSMEGWREVIAGIVALGMLGLYQLLGARLPLIVAGIAGALGAMQALATLGRIHSGGAVNVLGQQYRYLDAAWGLYLVLAGAIALLCCAVALARRASR